MSPQALAFMGKPLPYLPTNTACVAHYTNVAALTSILREDGIVLWATKYGYFEDEFEFSWPLSVLAPFLKDLAEQVQVDYDPEHKVFPYILSFSNGIDDEYMWSHYTNGEQGVMLVFDRIKLYDYCNSYIEKTGKTRYCMDVLYATSEDLKSVLADAYNQLQQNFQNINPIEPFYECPAFVKYKDRFSDEDEFRLIHCAYNSFKTTIENFNNPIHSEEFPNNLKFRELKGDLIPYVDIKIPKDCLVAVCVGNCMSECNMNAIDMLLNTRYYNVGVFKSRFSIQ